MHTQAVCDTKKFNYLPDNSLEVVIITNSTNDHDGYLELTAAIKLMSPFLSNASALWTNAASSHKLTKNNKNYIHVFSLFKYLSNYNLNNKKHPPEYYNIKMIICDLLMGVQSKSFDPLCEIKTQLCAIQESLNETIGTLNNHATTTNVVAPNNVDKLQEIVQNLHMECVNKMTFNTETILENIKNIKDLVCLAK